jgi:hypothetical protein
VAERRLDLDLLDVVEQGVEPRAPVDADVGAASVPSFGAHADAALEGEPLDEEESDDEPDDPPEVESDELDDESDDDEDASAGVFEAPAAVEDPERASLR